MRRVKYIVKANLYFWLIIEIMLTSFGCQTIRRGEFKSNNLSRETDRIWIVMQEEQVFETKVVDKEVLILPGGYFKANGTSKIIFTKPVTILSQQAVFDPDLEIESLPGTFEFININWFGANGMDNEDDTRPIQKVFNLIPPGGALQINIPIGKYYISKQIVVSGKTGNNIAFVLHGISSSYAGTNGSSFLWRGGNAESMFLISNTSQSIIENVDFNSSPNFSLATNIEFRPNCNQIFFKNCSFSGCTGDRSCNINLNEGNNLQVSEIYFDNCTFKGVFAEGKYTSNAIRGGWANTKNFQFSHCAIGPYRNEAIKIKTSDILKVDGCTFYLNDVDISCETCKTLATSNYSEESNAFFMSTASSNFNATTLINNQFTGKPKDGYVIRDGSGTLILLNNNFGGGNYLRDKNFIRWEENEYNSIYSTGNVYKNSSIEVSPFYNRSDTSYRKDRLFSFGDLGGMLGDNRVKINDSTH